MSEKNNKIKIGELLTQIEVTNLKKYFDTLNSEVSIKDLLYKVSDGIYPGELLIEPEVVSDVFTLVCYIWKNYKEKEREGDLQLSSDEINHMFSVLAQALGRSSGIERESKEVFDLVKDVWKTRKDEKDGNLMLRQSEIYFMFQALYGAIKGNNLKGLKAKEVFDLVKDIWETRKDEKDGNLMLGRFEIYFMFRALVFAIERGNSEGLKAKEVFDLVESILNQQNLEITKITVKFMLEALRLTYGIDEQLEKMESSLRALGLKIANGCICLTDNRESLPVDRRNVIPILKIIKEQNTEEKKNQDNDNNKENNEQKNKNKKIEDKGKNGTKDEEDGSTTFNINQFSSFDAFYKEIKDQTNNKTEAMDNLLNDNKALSNVPTNVWDIIKTFFWRLFCCMENPFHNLYNYTKLRVGFNQLKIQQQIGQDLSDSKLECEWFTTLRSHLLSKQENSKVSELKNGKNDLINK